VFTEKTEVNWLNRIQDANLETLGIDMGVYLSNSKYKGARTVSNLFDNYCRSLGFESVEKMDKRTRQYIHTEFIKKILEVIKKLEILGYC
jgi:hypothetical protein